MYSSASYPSFNVSGSTNAADFNGTNFSIPPHRGSEHNSHHQAIYNYQSNQNTFTQSTDIYEQQQHQQPHMNKNSNRFNPIFHYGYNNFLACQSTDSDLAPHIGQDQHRAYYQEFAETSGAAKVHTEHFQGRNTYFLKTIFMNEYQTISF